MSRRSSAAPKRRSRPSRSCWPRRGFVAGRHVGSWSSAAATRSPARRWSLEADMDSELSAYIAHRTEVLTKIRRMLVVSLNLRRKPETIDPDTSLFGTGLGIDSLDAVEIIVALEIEFKVKLADPIDR